MGPSPTSQATVNLIDTLKGIDIVKASLRVDPLFRKKKGSTKQRARLATAA